MLCLRMGSDSPKCLVFQCPPRTLSDSATDLTVRKNWLQISPLFMFYYIIHSKYLLVFCSLDVLSPLPAYSMPVFLFFPWFFCIFRSLSFLHISYVPVLSSFKGVFEFHDLVIVFLSRIKFIVLGFDLSRFCGSVTWSLCTVPTDLSCC